ncbi:hypothetical protein Nepgr_007512 [Nepenthes gracilis]|uniref:Uncharacterized protein n=1 Tax=Nepenthes gracilis TaxID=150966 RepID=A0AAD3S7Y7_NEPGR|nr:hypothetical protein Nepgr_007512 [Nepenthes gracilis]
MKKYKFLVCCIKPVAREDSFKSPELRMNSSEAVRSYVPLGDTAVFDRNINFPTSMPSNREGRWRRRKNIFSFVKAFLCEFSLVMFSFSISVFDEELSSLP